MKAVVYPGLPKGKVSIPASKSQTHRAIIAASLALGKSTISNISYSEDIDATIGAMEKIGARFIRSADKLTVYGTSKIGFTEDNFVECNESGSTLRFLIPVFSLCNQKVVFTGRRSLFQRPLGIYDSLFAKANSRFIKNDDSVIVAGSLVPGTYTLAGNVSSQFISGLLFALPLLDGSSEIVVSEPFESRYYVDMTVSVLKLAGIVVEQENNRYLIKGNQSYKHFDISLEGDFSQMAFFAVLGILAGDVECKNMPESSLQPDRAILNFISEAGVKYIRTETGYRFLASSLEAITCDVGQSPDLAPVLSVMAAFSQGLSSITNAARLKIKESNRLEAIWQIINGLGGKAELGNDYVNITGANELVGGSFNSFGDHRIVMSLAIAASRCQNPVLIKNAEAVNKSYPRFFRDLASLGLKIDFIKEEE